MDSLPSFANIDSALAEIMQALHRVLLDVGAVEVAESLPWPSLWNETGGKSTRIDFGSEAAEACVQAYSIAFQLLNMVEESSIAKHRRALEHAGHLHAESGSWDTTLAEANGLSPADAVALLRSVHVEPVLTAHPTEAKRQTVIEHHRELYGLLVELDSAALTASERDELRERIASCLERLWRTGEIYLAKPSIADERRAVMNYLTRVFPDVLVSFDARLRAAWSRAELPSALLEEASSLPGVSFGDWVGGDRDGHSGVTAQVTSETLQEFRGAAIALLDQRLHRLAVRLSLSSSRQSTPIALQRHVDELAARLGEAGAAACARNPGETWRQLINLWRTALLSQTEPGLMDCRSVVLFELAQLHGWLTEIGAERLARGDVEPIVRHVRTFGLHLAKLDVRQNSAFHDHALAELLRLAGVEGGESYAHWDVARRRTLLDGELSSKRPLAARGDVLGVEACAVLDAYAVLRDHRARHGDDGLGALIVSMTRSVEDLLAVYLLARESGLLLRDGDEVWCPLEVVPLLETIDDLERAPAILDEYLAHPLAATSMRRRQLRDGSDTPVQQVMIGYSDSCKDGGIVASYWSLYRTQRALTAIGQRRGVRIRFFHGRGGTIGRGAGPTHRFLRALPPGALAGDLRLTEQGETISQRYANEVTAAHHLELLSAGAFSALLRDRKERSDPAELLALMDELAVQSRSTYRALLEHPHFIAFFAQATPIDAIEASRIGSRPARRTGKRTLSDLRAIPWVFAWNQSRFVLPGWFGLGSALEALRERDPEGFERLAAAKREESRWAPLHYLVSNAATAWMTSSREIMEHYATLVDDVAVRASVLEVILAEHARTQHGLEALYAGSLDARRPKINAMLARRSSALEPLHAHQIALLRRFRSALSRGHQEDADSLLPQLLLAVNAIASGLGATG